MSCSISLSQIEAEKIKDLAEEFRRKAGFIGDVPIADDIFIVLDNLDIKLLEYPVKGSAEEPAFSAALIYYMEENEEFVFIGLNTADYFDKQIYAVAHELYHYMTKTPSQLCRLSKNHDDELENKANRFAEELLLPEKVLTSVILKEFKNHSLEKLKTNVLLRFIARLYCTWRLPYRAIIKRLKDIDAISGKQYELLTDLDERDKEGEFALLGKAINQEIFDKLNLVTCKIGVSQQNIEVVIRNFEDGLISEDQFAELLGVFNKTPEDYGYYTSVSKDDLLDIKEYMDREKGIES